MLTQVACAEHISIQRAESSQLLYDCLVDPKVLGSSSNSCAVSLKPMFTGILYSPQAQLILGNPVCPVWQARSPIRDTGGL